LLKEEETSLSNLTQAILAKTFREN